MISEEKVELKSVKWKEKLDKKLVSLKGAG